MNVCITILWRFCYTRYPRSSCPVLVLNCLCLLKKLSVGGVAG